MAKFFNSLTFVALSFVIIAISAWEPPKLPAGRRLQYYILHPEGDYVFGYDTGEGSFHAAKSDASNRVRGSYNYGGKSTPGSLTYSYTGGLVLPGSEANVGAVVQKTNYEAAPVVTSDESGPADASYSFSFDAGDHSRQESSDPSGYVRGSYAFTANDGVNRQVNYEAGAERGFIAQGAHLPVAPESGAAPAPVSVYNNAVPVSKYAPPTAPVSSQSSVSQNQDASYSFSYDAGDHSRSESSDSVGNVRGRFAFVAKDGVERKVDYEAGAEKGFVAKGDHLPVADVPVSIYSQVPITQAATFKYDAPKVSTPTVLAKIDSNTNQDGSYSFSYDAGDHSRQESVDALGNVRGHFAFVANDGVNRKVDYEAGAEKGFLAKGSHLPVPQSAPAYPAPSAPAVIPSLYTAPKPNTPLASPSIENSPVDGAYSFSYDAGDHSREESADSAGNVKGRFSFVAKDGVLRKVNYEAGAEKGFLASGDHIPSEPTLELKKTFGSYPSIPAPIVPSIYTPSPVATVKGADISSTSGTDGSYSFSYVADDHSREESSDAAGNVRGHFSFVAKDGVNRKVDYEAGAEKGFLAKGAHIPVAPEVSAVPSVGSPVLTPTSYYVPTPVVEPSSVNSYDNSPVDGSYSFSYDAEDHSRQESADSAGNVRGYFSFTPKDGITRKVDYEAGAEKGFVAKGDHIPQVDAHVELKKIAAAPVPIPVAPVSHTVPASASVYKTVKAADIRSSSQGDGSYSFSYEADDHSRQESADAAGNVRGSFAFKATDGVNRKVEYEAGAEKGFVAKGAHLPDPSAIASPLALTPSTYTAPKPVVPITSSANVDSPIDGSYSFSYDVGDHSRQESADSAGNVKGYFAFKATDGVNRKVDYEAGAEKGFLAKGDHIPTDDSFGRKVAAPSVPIIPHSQAAKSSVSITPPVSAYPPASVISTGPVDASYSFSYDAADHSRQESADAAGNVKGTFSFVAKDGLNRKVDYEAGAERGFLAHGGHLPAPALIGGTSGSGYKYSYETDSSKKTESSDANGFVVGSFSYLGADGITRKVDYRAGGEEGFVPIGDHLQPAVTVQAKQSPSFGAKAAHVSTYKSFSSTSGSAAAKVKPVESAHSVRTFLAPESPSKFGYIYDTLA